MFKFSIRKLTVGLLAAGIFGLIGAGSAQAGGYGYENCTWKKVTTWQTVTTYETRQEAYDKSFTLYDHCNRPYTVTKTLYRNVQVPVYKQVPVTKWVKVCY